MTPEELAQRLADRIEPPYFSNDRRTDLRHAELKKLPWEERFVDVLHRKGPDDQPYLTFTAGDGYPSFRAATFLEIAKAVLEVLSDDEYLDPGEHVALCVDPDCKFCKGREKWDQFLNRQ